MQIRFYDDLFALSCGTLLRSVALKTPLNYFGCNGLWLGVAGLPSLGVIVEADFAVRLVELVQLVTVKAI